MDEKIDRVSLQTYENQMNLYQQILQPITSVLERSMMASMGPADTIAHSYQQQQQQQQQSYAQQSNRPYSSSSSRRSSQWERQSNRPSAYNAAASHASLRDNLYGASDIGTDYIEAIETLQGIHKQTSTYQSTRTGLGSKSKSLLDIAPKSVSRSSSRPYKTPPLVSNKLGATSSVISEFTQQKLLLSQTAHQHSSSLDPSPRLLTYLDESSLANAATAPNQSSIMSSLTAYKSLSLTHGPSVDSFVTEVSSSAVSVESRSRLGQVPAIPSSTGKKLGALLSNKAASTPSVANSSSLAKSPRHQGSRTPSTPSATISTKPTAITTSALSGRMTPKKAIKTVRVSTKQKGHNSENKDKSVPWALLDELQGNQKQFEDEVAVLEFNLGMHSTEKGGGS